MFTPDQYLRMFHIKTYNYRNGRWRSVWTVAVSDDGRDGEVSGVLKVQVNSCEKNVHN